MVSSGELQHKITPIFYCSPHPTVNIMTRTKKKDNSEGQDFPHHLLDSKFGPAPPSRLV